MLRSILIGLDSSASGIAAQELGIEWSQQLGCQLIGITIVDGPVFSPSEDNAYGQVSGRGVGSSARLSPRRASRSRPACERSGTRSEGAVARLKSSTWWWRTSARPTSRSFSKRRSTTLSCWASIRTSITVGKISPARRWKRYSRTVPGRLSSCPSRCERVCRSPSLTTAVPRPRAPSRCSWRRGQPPGGTVHIIAAANPRRPPAGGAAAMPRAGDRVPEQSRHQGNVSPRRIGARACRR